MSRRQHNGEDAERAREREREHQLHQANLGRQDGERGAHEILKYISEGDVDEPSGVLSWFTSKISSTSNLGADDVKSREWRQEYQQLMARMERPPHYGTFGHRRAWARGAREGYREPLEPDDALAFEGYTEAGKMTLHKSKQGWGTETATRDVKESYVRKEDRKEAGGGLLSRFRRN